MRVEESRRVREFANQTGAWRFFDRFALLDYSLKVAPPDGLFLEFGVHKGVSLNYIADRVEKVYGFDSFSGIEEDWTPHYRKGHFGLEALPEVNENAELVVGMFQDTLGPFLEQHSAPTSFVHLDADLYSSTHYVLFTLARYGRLIPGTVIQFDELFWKEGDKLYDDEFRAYKDFAKEFEPNVRWLGYCGSHGEEIEGAKFALCLEH